MGKISSVEAVLSNNDLLIQILTRVPPYPLTTFQVVSKQWLSIISDPHFVVAQTRHYLTTHPPSSRSLFTFQTKVQKDSQLFGTETILIGNSSNLFRKLSTRLNDVQQNAPFKYPDLDVNESNYLSLGLLANRPHNIISSCNGLILYQDGVNMPFIVLNPTTLKYRLLPEPLGSRGYETALGTALAFDPSKSFHYKIIRFRSLHFPDYVVDIDIFSSESGTWKEIHLQNPPGSGGVVCDTRIIFWNGALHWIASPDFHVSFVVDEEKFTWHEIPNNPDTLSERDDFGYFGESDNGLLLFKFSSDDDDNVFTVLEMDKENRWSPKHQLNLKPLVSKFTDMNLLLKDGMRKLNFSVLYVKSGTKYGDFSMRLAIAKKIISFEMREGNGGTDSKVRCEFPYYILGSYHDMHPIIECLAPVL